MPEASDFPALPQITGDLILETFSHKSLKLDYDPEISTDNERLIELGRTMLQFATTRYLYAKKPIVPASDIPALRNEILTSENYETWVAHYNLRQRLRYIHSDAFDLMNPEETRNLFQAYVGAVVWQSGPVIATNWITRLINPEATILSTTDSDALETDEHRANKRPRAEIQAVPPESLPPPVPAGLPPASTTAYTPIPTYHGAAQATNTSTAATASPAIGPQAAPNKAAPKSVTFLPMFNQRCSQQHLQFEYQAANHAAPHAPLWVIKCFVNGIQKGEGQGTNKQVAKEAAAREAYYAMGWAAYGQPG